jgi:hypothetical protein
LFFQKGVAIFYSVVAVPCSPVPLTLKATEFSVPSLQHGHNCYNI